MNLGATMGIHITNHFQSLWYPCTCKGQHQNFITHSFSHSDKPLQMYSYCQGKSIGVVPGAGLLFWVLFKYHFSLAFKEIKSDILEERRLLEGCGIQPPSSSQQPQKRNQLNESASQPNAQLSCEEFSPDVLVPTRPPTSRRQHNPSESEVLPGRLAPPCLRCPWRADGTPCPTGASQPQPQQLVPIHACFPHPHRGCQPHSSHLPWHFPCSRQAEHH